MSRTAFYSWDPARQPNTHDPRLSDSFDALQEIAESTTSGAVTRITLEDLSLVVGMLTDEEMYADTVARQDLALRLAHAFTSPARLETADDPSSLPAELL